jgi:Protein of unknown function (DUF3761)
VKRAIGVVVVLALLIGALSSHGKSSTSTSTSGATRAQAATGSLASHAPDRASRASSTRTSYTHCDQNISVGAHTTCGFADNVFRAFAALIDREDTALTDYTVEATSPATGKTYSMSCRTSGATTECSGGRGARIRFPLYAAQVYSQPSQVESPPSYESEESETEESTPGEAESESPEEEPECTNGTYVNSAGNTVCSPEESPDGPPAGATAECQDGTYSFSESRSGTCSHHGGVANWL